MATDSEKVEGARRIDKADPQPEWDEAAQGHECQERQHDSQPVDSGLGGHIVGSGHSIRSGSSAYLEWGIGFGLSTFGG